MFTAILIGAGFIHAAVGNPVLGGAFVLAGALRLVFDIGAALARADD